MLELPRELRDAIAQALATTPAPRWINAAQALSERYRGERSTRSAALASGPDQVLGYAALILPAAYAQLRGAMAATAARVPGWSPTSMLDLGSGPGTALWAACEQWPGLQSLVAWEREPSFVALGQRLATAGPDAVRAAHWERRNLHGLEPISNQRYDLVVLGHVLNELDDHARHAVVAAAWSRTRAVLLIVEPGTSTAFPIVRAARDQLLADGATTLAPCAHDRPCPLQNDWCHFPQRLVRPDFQKRVRGAPSAWEDAKYCYAAMSRAPTERAIWARVINEPRSNKAYAEALLSTRAGIQLYRALKRHREQFRIVKDLGWGQAIDMPLEQDE
jgi:ribosomal protein RSM22 (predicted rRNA methylase)